MSWQKTSDSKPNILVVEDNEIAVLQIRSTLEGQGYSVEVAPGGVEAIKSVTRKIPDAIILDLMMPDIDGFQVLEQLRSTEKTAKIPVLVLTAKELTKEDHDRLTYNNIFELVQKGSVDKEQLMGKVMDLIGIKPEKHKVKPAKSQKNVNKKIRTNSTILVVEDNPDNMITITAVLEEIGHEYIKAEDGEKAVKAAKESMPALILMDMQLPKLSGLEASKLIKADDTLADIPIIALTAKAMKGDKEEILAGGCDDYLSKPFDPDDLAAIVKKWMS